MKSFKQIAIFTLLVSALFVSITASAAGIGNNIVVRLVGTDMARDGTEMFELYGLEPPEEVLCFDVDLVDAKSGNVIGSASDCLSSISGDKVIGMALTGTTFFFFPGGTLISQGLTTVQPVLHGSPDSTHITGAIPSPDGNDVIYGDGKFKNANGPVRLSGAVNLDMLGNGIITFDCVFIIDI
jgi:hypothetical protein